MKKFCLKLIPSFLAFLLFINVSFAAEFALTKIGALDTGGATYSEWWYTGTSPTLMGTAENNAQVSVTINDQTNTVNADSSGNWSVPTTLDNADYNITVASGSSSYSFVLHAGQSVPSDLGSTTTTTTTETQQTTTPVPATGFNQTIGLILSSTILGFGIYFFNKSKKSTKKAYVKSLLKEL